MSESKTSTSGKLSQLRGILAYGLGPALGILSGPILARSLGPPGRGQLAAIMQPITVAGAVASVGIPAAVTYFIAKGRDPRQTYKNALILTAIPALIVYLAMALYSGVVEEVQGIERSVLLIAWIAIILSAVVQIRRGFWQGMAKWKLLDLERGTYAILRFAAVVGVALLGVGYAYPYAFVSLGAFVLAAALLWPTSRRHSIPKGEPPKVSEVRGYAAAASIGTIMTVANNRLDQVLFPAAGDSTQLGYYAVAVTVAEVPLVFGVLAARNLLTVSSKGGDGWAMLSSVRLYLIGLLAGSLALAVLSAFAVPLVFGTEFAPATLSVVLLCTGTVFAGGSIAAVAILSGWGKPGLSSVLPVAGLVVTVAGFAFQWGNVTSTYAAALAMISQLVAFIVGIFILALHRRRKGDRR